jgi:inner membrane protein
MAPGAHLPILSAVIFASLASLFAKSQKILVWFMSLLVVHIHLLCDLVGSRGPDEYQWPIYYFYPFNSLYGFTWGGQWRLNAWENQLIMLILLVFCIYYLIIKKVTFFEVFSSTLDKAAVGLYEKYRGRNKNQ